MQVRGHRQIETQNVEHNLLHVQDLIPVVGAVGDVDEITDFRGPDFFVFGGHQHGGDAHQLQVLAADLFGLQEAVDEVHSQVESFGHEFEFEVDVNEPVHEDGAHFLVDVCLTGHVGFRHSDFGLCALVKGHHVLDEGHGSQRVLLVVFIDGWDNVKDAVRARSRSKRLLGNVMLHFRGREGDDRDVGIARA